MTAAAPRRSVVKYLYNHNPFYAISASLMLFAVLKAYGHLEVGEINTWIMVGVLAGYTSVLAVIGVLIVRWGKVWEDARSILMLLLLLFLAVSVCSDDLFVRLKSTQGGTLLLLCGYVFSAVVTESVLRGARIRMGWRFRVPYHLMLALFYAVPWWCSPQFNTLRPSQIEWTLFLFPAIAGVLFLGLLPAVRRGPDYVAANGTPWRWPWFPWCAFGMLAVAFSMRSFALCLAFGPKGPIWKELETRSGIVFDTIWSPYFLVPLAFAILVLLLETGIVNGNLKLQRRVMSFAPLLLLLSLPVMSNPISDAFLEKVTGRLGSPIWLTSWMLAGLYAIAAVRRVPFAEWGLASSLLLFCVVGPQTVDLRTFTSPQAWPAIAAGGLLLASGVWQRSSQLCCLAVCLGAIGLHLVLLKSIEADHAVAVSYHFLLISVLAVTLAFPDGFARLMQKLIAMQMPIAALVVMIGVRTAHVPFGWRLAYVLLLAAASLAIARLWRIRWFVHAFAATCGVAGYGIVLVGFRVLVAIFGKTAMTAFSWSVAALLLAFLISAHKAKWLPKRLIPRPG